MRKATKIRRAVISITMTTIAELSWLLSSDFSSFLSYFQDKSIFSSGGVKWTPLITAPFYMAEILFPSPMRFLSRSRRKVNAAKNG